MTSLDLADSPSTHLLRLTTLPLPHPHLIISPTTFIFSLTDNTRYWAANFKDIPQVSKQFSFPASFPTPSSPFSWVSHFGLLDLPPAALFHCTISLHYFTRSTSGFLSPSEFSQSSLESISIYLLTHPPITSTFPSFSPSPHYWYFLSSLHLSITFVHHIHFLHPKGPGAPSSFCCSPCQQIFTDSIFAVVDLDWFTAAWWVILLFVYCRPSQLLPLLVPHYLSFRNNITDITLPISLSSPMSLLWQPCRLLPSNFLPSSILLFSSRTYFINLQEDSLD